MDYILCLFYSLPNIQRISFTLSFKCGLNCQALTLRLLSLSILDVMFSMSLQGWLRKDDRKRLKDREWGRKGKAIFLYKRERKGKRVPLENGTAPGSSVGLSRGSYEKGKEDKRGEARRGTEEK